MKLGTQEHYEILTAFEKAFNQSSIAGQTDKEDKELWSKGVFYKNGVVNDCFKIYSQGYAQARCKYINQ